MEAIKYTGSANVPGGPSLGFTQTMQLTSYTKYKVAVPKKTGTTDGEKVFEIAGANIGLLLVRASSYAKLRYTVNAEAAADKTKLEVPLLIGGESAVKRFAGDAAANLTKLTFYNEDTASDITVEVFIGRA